jgi:oligoribonuclease (3'-5' exoribonuclease)
MPTPKFLVTDTETGGLDDRINPILSVSLLIADENLQEADGWAQKIKPPGNTMLEVPVLVDQNPETRKKRVEYYLDIYTKEKYQALPETSLVINAVAAEINGFVQFGSNGKWDIGSIDKWLNVSLPVAEVDTIYTRYITDRFTSKPVGVAHNAEFDEKFLRRYLPLLHSNYYPNWFCTVKAMRKWYKDRSLKGSAKLAELDVKSGYTPAKAHEALSDCRSCLAGLRWLVKEQTSLEQAGGM